MLYLLLAITANTSMSFIMKYSESHSRNRYGITVFNYAIGVIISYILLESKNIFDMGEDMCFTVGLSVLNACLFVGCLLLIQYSIAKNGIPMSTTFNRLGILIPTFFSGILFREIPNALQIVGLGLAVFAIIFMNGGIKASGKGGLAPSLILLFVVGGSVDMISKIFSYYGNVAHQEIFIFYTFLFSLLISIMVLIRKNRRITTKDMIIGVLVGIPNQMATLCLLKAVAVFPAYLVFPIYSAGVILIVNVINLIVFKETLSKHEYVGTGIIAIALVCINC